MPANVVCTAASEALDNDLTMVAASLSATCCSRLLTLPAAAMIATINARCFVKQIMSSCNDFQTAHCIMIIAKRKNIMNMLMFTNHCFKLNSTQILESANDGDDEHDDE